MAFSAPDEGCATLGTASVPDEAQHDEKQRNTFQIWASKREREREEEKEKRREGERERDGERERGRKRDKKSTMAEADAPK